MGPMESTLAIRSRNKIGNICPACRAELQKTKSGRHRLLLWNLKVVLRCACFLGSIFLVFAALIVALATIL